MINKSEIWYDMILVQCVQADGPPLLLTACSRGNVDSFFFFFFSKLWKLKLNWLRQRWRSRPIVNTLDYLCPELVTWLWSPEKVDTNLTKWKIYFRIYILLLTITKFIQINAKSFCVLVNTNCSIIHWQTINEKKTNCIHPEIDVGMMAKQFESVFVLSLNVFMTERKMHKSGIFVKRRKKFLKLWWTVTVLRCVSLSRQGVQHVTQGHFSSSRNYLNLQETQQDPRLL